MNVLLRRTIYRSVRELRKDKYYRITGLEITEGDKGYYKVIFLEGEVVSSTFFCHQGDDSIIWDQLV